MLLIVVLCFSVNAIQAQDSTYTFKQILDQKIKEVPKLNEKVNISVGNVSIQEFLRSVANNSGVNIDVDPSLQFNVTNNFSEVRVSDILLFLDEQFALDINFIGNIITIKGTGEVVQSKTNKVIFDYENNLITIDFNNEPINSAIREIIQATGNNIILSPGLDSKQIKGYIQNMPFDKAIEKLAFTNGLEARKTKDNIFTIRSAEKDENKQQLAISNYNRGKQVNVESFRRKGIQISTERADSICIYASNAEKIDLIEVIAGQLGINYFIASELKGQITLNVEGISFEEFLDYVLSGSEYTYKNIKDVYIIGGKSINELNEYRVVQLKHRTVDSLIHILPKEMIENIEIKEFVELNSVFLAGASNKINLVDEFIRLIDKPVPVILIEIIIVDVTKSNSMSTGIQAGLGQAPSSNQTILPGVDYTMSSAAINSLINKFDGFGWVNLGNVSEDFYITLKAMETNGLLDIKSTPKLSTLNGHTANLKIGETKYYKEERSQLYGTQNPTQTNSYEFKSVDADLSITIRPVVSGDNQITLDISVKQSDFDLTGSSLGEGAPPNKRNKEFKSTIRIKNEDVIILGGLEQKQSIDSGSGIPFLSRVPILKWFFSSKTKSKSDAKLNVFIKPTIIG